VALRPQATEIHCSLPSPAARRKSDAAIFTPHTAFYSVEALEELQTKCASDVARVLSGQKAVYSISA
jgi:D-3-phosphoglycerate dehydrogenase / 2-oxoglutarate reductase